MKKLLALIAAVVTLFTFAPTKAEAGSPYRYHPSQYLSRGSYYSSRSYRPVYHSHYRSAPRYYPSYRTTRYYQPRYSSYHHGHRGTSVSVHTRFGSFHIR